MNQTHSTYIGGALIVTGPLHHPQSHEGFIPSDLDGIQATARLNVYCALFLYGFAKFHSKMI